MLRTAFLSLFILLIGSTYLKSQQLSEDPASFVKEAGKLLTDVKRTETKETADLLKTNFEEAKFSEQQLQEVIATSNKILQNMRAYPYLEQYLRGVNNTVTYPLNSSKFTEWNNVVDQIIDNSRRGDNKPFQRFLDFTNAFLSTGYIYTSNTKNWEARGDQFSFSYDQKPVVTFGKITLVGTTSGDSVILPLENSIYFPSEEQWIGRKGKIDWSNAGLDPNQVYATYENISLDLSKSEFVIDTADLYYGALSKEPMPGKLTHKLMINPSGSAKYPQFQTFQKSFEIPEIVKGVAFKGGFEINGSTISGYGDADNKAELLFRNDRGQLVAKAKSKSFIIEKQERLASSGSEMAIYFGEDSIYHPGLNLKYRVVERELSGTTGEAGIARSSFYDSYHNVDIRVERFSWRIDQPEIHFSIITAGEQNPAYFESENLFEKKKYDTYQGAMSYNPISVIKRYSESFKTRAIPANDVAKAFNPNLNVEQIRRTLFQLTEDGFIFYDREAEMVYVKDKVYNYVFANGKLIDYDIIKIESKSSKVNATFDLNNREMKIDGVYNVDLSDAQFVKIFPKEKKLTLLENRDMKFSGTVFAGRLDFFGKDYRFSYDSFTVQLLRLDSMTINVPVKKEGTETAELIPLNTSFENLTGKLYIDIPNNKSGKEKNLQYPIFENKSPTYAYYDNRAIYKDVYKRDKFFFEIEPFTIDSLNSFSIATQNFNGTLHSANIFPPVKESLKVREDHSLGFTSQTPATGYPLYNGKGTYFEKIDLSNRGLRGNGRLTHLSATIVSDDIVFFPDSMDAVAQTFSSKESTIGGADFPNATAKDPKIHWEPYNDMMWVKSEAEPIFFFDNYATLNGNVRLTPKGMRGDGLMDWADATLASQDFHFGKFSVAADTSDLKIKALDKTKVAFNLPNVRSNINFGEKKGNFRSNELDIPTELPYNQYQTTMNEFDWDIEKRQIEFKPPKDKEYSLFVSTRPDQKGIYFEAKGGKYDMNSYMLNASGVPLIKVADAHVIPAKGNVTIEAEAKMQQLKDAKVITDTTGKKYQFYDATIDISSKEKFTGSGKYDYKNRSGESQSIYFAELGVKGHVDSLYTYGKAVLADTQLLYIDPKIAFRGDINMHSKQPNLNFNGYSKLEVKDTALIKTDWFRINDSINPSRVMLTTLGSVSDARDSITSGIHLRSDSTNLYTTIAGSKIFRRDATIFDATGMVTYDPDKKEYLVAPAKKLNGLSKTGDLMRYNEATGEIYGEGLMDLGLDLQMVDFKGSGNVQKNAADTTFTFNLFTGMKFFLTKEVLEMMTNDLVNLTFDSPELEYLQEDFQNNMSRFIGDEKAAEKFLTQLNKTGEFNIPGGHTLVLTDLQLIWDEYSGTFRSKNGHVGVATVNGKRVGKKMKGYVEFGKRRLGDFFNIYLETELGDWYFITYQENMLQILSSNVHFNDLVMDIKPDNRRMKGPNDQYITFTVSSPSKKASFVDRMRYYQNN